MNIRRQIAVLKNLPSAARQTQIRERFAARPGVSVSGLALEFDVSAMTIRRDLAVLEDQAHIQRRGRAHAADDAGI